MPRIRKFIFTPPIEPSEYDIVFTRLASLLPEKTKWNSGRDLNKIPNIEYIKYLVIDRGAYIDNGDFIKNVPLEDGWKFIGVDGNIPWDNLYESNNTEYNKYGLSDLQYLNGIMFSVPAHGKKVYVIGAYNNKKHTVNIKRYGKPNNVKMEAHKLLYILNDKTTKIYGLPKINTDHLYESVEEDYEYTPKVGDLLIFNPTNGRFDGLFIKDMTYEVISSKTRIGSNNIPYDVITILNKDEFDFTIEPDDIGLSYKTWFTPIPKDIRDFDFFGSLHESIDNIEEYTPKIGDLLYTIKPMRIYGTNDFVTTEGKAYEIINIYGDNRVEFIDDEEGINRVTIGNDFFNKHFIYIGDKDNLTNTESLFDNLYESIEEKRNVTVIKFDPPIKQSENKDILSIIQVFYPDWRWVGKKKERLNQWIPGRDMVALMNDYNDNGVTWTPGDGDYYNDEIDLLDENDIEYEIIDGWEMINSYRSFDTNAAFESLYESIDNIEEYTPKVGDYLMCMPIDSAPEFIPEIKFTKNKFYLITHVSGNHITMSDDKGRTNRSFTIQPDRDGFSYKTWFTPIPKDIIDFDFFGSLYEQEDDGLDWAREAVANTPDIPVPDGKSYYILRFKNIPTKEDIINLSNLIESIGWEWRGGKLDDTNIEYLINYRIESNEAYISLSDDNTMSFGKTPRSYNWISDVDYNEVPQIWV